MEIDFSEINYLQDPSFQDLHADYEQFLLSMTGPTVIDITGENTHKYRVILTLLQGDEPSGLIAIHRWLTARNSSELPSTNLRFIICSVEAASKSPLFSKRFIEGSKDLNRCFGNNEIIVNINNYRNGSKNKGCYQRARLIEKAIREVNPEAVIDLHNASSPSPTFAVSTVITTESLTLASFFSQTLILSDLHLGTLMEQPFSYPFITIECGCFTDEQSHETAYSGINQIATCENISCSQQNYNVEVIYNTLRLQTQEGIKLSFSDHDEGYRGITLKRNIEYLNFGGSQKDEMIGWTDGNGTENLQILNKEGTNVVNDYFYTRENQLVCRQNFRIFKATSNKEVALNDCLFYLVVKPICN